ncbi:MAG: hypothetical protein MZV63_31850 [Marinilabiliales bacterium]|nr:hypothetical protein [Marinilabiliales bacterium]
MKILKLVITGETRIDVLPAYGAITLNAEYTVTQDDLDTGLISSFASISGNYPDGKSFTEKSNPVTLLAVQSPVLVSSLSSPVASFQAAGDTIHYTLEIRNIGNQTISGIGFHPAG